MPAVTLKNIPRELYEKIKKSAALNFRSINSEILFRLQEVLTHHPIDRKAYLRRINELQKRIKLPPLTEDLLDEAKKAGRP
jgi:hypothetical protein